MRLIFQLGTNNWQTENEPAPGSGILHEAQHNLMNKMEGVKCYSMFPSPKAESRREDYRIFKLNHPIPICESAAPESSYRWHSMTENEFESYRKRLENEVFDFMEEIEKRENQPITLVIAHHAFLNPLVMRDVIERRLAQGKIGTPLCCFLHGTALKMYEHELLGENTTEYPMRFHKLMLEEKVFQSVSLCIANSPALLPRMAKIFPDYPHDRILISTPGVDENLFFPRPTTLPKVLQLLGKPVWPTVPQIPTGSYDKLIVFVGKLADLKRVDSLLLAAAKYEPNLPRTCTLVIGGGPAEEFDKLTKLAETLELKNAYLMGPKSQDVLAQVYTVASAGVFPSFEESFGMVFIECMACRCPVVGVNSGGPAGFITREVGELVPEPGMWEIEKLGESLLPVIERAIGENWKEMKGEKCVQLVKNKFSAKALTEKMLSDTLTMAYDK